MTAQTEALVAGRGHLSNNHLAGQHPFPTEVNQGTCLICAGVGRSMKRYVLPKLKRLTPRFLHEGALSWMTSALTP